MDTKCKGIAWLGNIYQKFEDMCLEVDEIVQKEISKHAESLETVGANMKSFFSELELIGDALPQSSVDIKEWVTPDSSHVKNTDDASVGTDEDCDKRSLDEGVRLGSVEFVKSISSVLSSEENGEPEMNKFQLQTSDKKYSSNALLLHGVYHGSQEIELDGGANTLTPTSDDVGGSNSLMETKDRSSNDVVMSSNISDDIRFSSSVNLVKPSKRVSADIGPCPADALAVSNYNDAAYLTTDVTVSSPRGIELDYGFVKSKSVIPLPVYDSFDESGSSKTFPESEGRDNDDTKSGLQSSQSSNKVKLDESCIMVDGTGIQSILREEPKCRSYKRKLKDALSSKMRLLKKHNHKPHADWYGDLDAGFYQRKKKSFTTPTLAEKSKSSDYEFSESEWEIV